jgi:GGDEF domain-containing protein
MGQRDLLSELSQTVAAYLSTVQVVSETLEAACPEVGRPYHSRIMRLRSRVAFEATPAAIHESADALHAELAGYAAAASDYMDAQNRELRHGVAVMEKSVEELARRVDYYGSSLRQVVDRLESYDHAEESGNTDAPKPSHADALRTCIDCMTHETASLIAKTRSAIRENALRLAQAQVTDDSTGMLTKHEMERQIEARRRADVGFTLLLFELQGAVDDGVMKQAAAKLTSRFRHNDLLGRWSETEFLLLFQGDPGLAETRANQALPWINGAYAANDGGTIEIQASFQVLKREPAFV